MKQQRIAVLGHTMHYVEQGQGAAILLLHGIPVSSIIWRNIMPTLSSYGRCIAPDLMGMGQSDKPDIEYTIFQHIECIEAFIEALGLTSMTLVMHGWGSVVGFEYARRYPEKVNALAFYESHIRPMVDWQMLSLPVQQLVYDLQSSEDLDTEIVDRNFLLEKFLPMGMLCELDSEVMAQYQAPFAMPEYRKPLLTYARELPIGPERTPVMQLVQGYSKYLCQTDIPKCMLYGIPGFITTISTVAWAKINLSSLHLCDLGEAFHFAQETQPEIFAKTLMKWYISEVLPTLELA